MRGSSKSLYCNWLPLIPHLCCRLLVLYFEWLWQLPTRWTSSEPRLQKLLPWVQHRHLGRNRVFPVPNRLHRRNSVLWSCLRYVGSKKGYLHRRLYCNDRYFHSGYDNLYPQPLPIHDWPIRLRLWGSAGYLRWSNIHNGDVPSCLPRRRHWSL